MNTEQQREWCKAMAVRVMEELTAALNRCGTPHQQELLCRHMIRMALGAHTMRLRNSDYKFVLGAMADLREFVMSDLDSFEAGLIIRSKSLSGDMEEAGT